MDEISLIVNGIAINDFVSYSIDSDIYNAADAFEFEVTGIINNQIKVGSLCTLTVNGKIEMTGIIDAVAQSYDKNGITARISGRDLMGLLVDHCPNDFAEEESLNGISLKALTLRLLSDVPFIKKSDVVFESGSSSSAQPTEYTHIEPGTTIFDVLKRYASSNGLLFYSSSDGKLVFNVPVSSGKPEFSLVCRRDGMGNNIISGSYTHDITEAYSSTTVQAQDQDGVNEKATVTMPEFPYKKPLIISETTENPAKEAKKKVNAQRSTMKRWEYTCHGHSMAGKNFTTNKLAIVDDEIFGTKQALLIYARTFKLSKSDGVTTALRLGLPGLRPE
jgi:prophage tail gpP-like protein